MYEEAQQPGKSATEKEQLIKTAIERIRPNNGLGYINDGKITDKGLQFISDFSRDVNKLRSTEAYQLNQMTDTIMKSQHYDVLEPIDFVDKPELLLTVVLTLLVKICPSLLLITIVVYEVTEC